MLVGTEPHEWTTPMLPCCTQVPHAPISLRPPKHLPCSHTRCILHPPSFPGHAHPELLARSLLLRHARRAGRADAAPLPHHAQAGWPGQPHHQAASGATGAAAGGGGPGGMQVGPRRKWCSGYSCGWIGLRGGAGGWDPGKCRWAPGGDAGEWDTATQGKRGWAPLRQGRYC